MSSLWGEGDEAQLLESELRLICIPESRALGMARGGYWRLGALEKEGGPLRAASGPWGPAVGLPSGPPGLWA